MKYNIKHILKFTVGIFFLLATISACDDPNDLGLEILPGTDLINVKNKVIKDEISAYVNSESGIVTNRESYNLLGSINDPVFGNTTVDYATQYRIVQYPGIGTNPTADSTFLYLYYRIIYGDTITPQNIKIYELEAPLNADIDYTQDVDLKSMASTQPIGEYTFTPKVELDSASQDTLFQVVKIPIDNSLGQRLLDADSLDLISNDAFLSYFKGLYIETEKLSTSESGTLITLSSAAEYRNFVGSYYNEDTVLISDLQVFYKSDTDTATTEFFVTQYSARVNHIQHDYSETDFANDIDQDVEQEEFLHVQPTGGLKSYITIDDLESWRDSTNISINKAELVFQVDTIASNIDYYPPPSQLILTFLATDSAEYRPIDYFFHPVFHDGYLRADYTYHFNITQHLQRVIDVFDPEDENYVGNQGFYLTTGQRSSNAQRVVLEGTGGENGVKLIITYSEYLK